MDEQARNRRLAANIAAGRSPLDGEIVATLRKYVEANLDVPGPRVGQLLDERDQLAAEVARLRAMERRAQALLSNPDEDEAWQHAARHILGEA